MPWHKREDEPGYDKKAYDAWSAAVRKRDGNRCQMPNCRYKGRRKNSHHILPWASHVYLRYTVDNGITLCETCHRRIGKQEMMYAGLFQTIILQKKMKEAGDG